MVNEHALTVSLEEFGLSKYEAQAYVSLIAKGTITASELAYYSEIPRTKIYPTLLKLEKKKLTIISKSKPIMCTAIAPEDAFDGIIHEQINKVDAMNTLVSNLKRASEESRKSRGSEEKRYFQLGTNNVLAQLQTMIEGSRSSIKIMADQWGFGLLAECKEQLVSVLRRNLDVKLLVQPTQICSESYRTIPDGVEIRASEITQNCFIFDETDKTHLKAIELERIVAFSLEILSQIKKRIGRISGVNSITKVLPASISTIRTVSAQLFDIVPPCSHNLSELSIHLGSIVLDSAALTNARFDFSQSNEESSTLLNEVKLMVDSKISKQYPNLDFFKLCNT